MLLLVNLQLLSELRHLTSLNQDPEIRLHLEWEVWQPKIIKYANINAAGKKLSPAISYLFDLTKKNVPTGMYVDIYVTGPGKTGLIYT